MAKKPKHKERDGPTQAERFIEAARKSGADESGKEFERAFRKVVPPKRPPKKNTDSHNG